jgi:hypothetical protein
MRVHYVNLIDASGVIFIPSTYDVSFPADPWKTGTTVAAESVAIDLGSAKAVTSVILLDHTLTSGDTLIKLQAHTSNTWGAPSFTTDLTWASGTIAKVFAQETYRWWRVIFTKSAAGEQREIGRLFLGTYYTTTEGPTPDFEIDPQDLTERQRTEGGQIYSDAKPDFREFKLTFAGISTTQKEAFEAFADAVGIHTSFFFQTDETAAVTPGKFGERIYAKLKRKPKYKPGGWHTDGDLCWETQLELEEQL